MTAIDDALAAGRLRLVAALWDLPDVRAALSQAQITAAVDVAMNAAQLRTLLEGVVAADVVVSAVVADVSTPPPSVSGAVLDFTPVKDAIGEGWGPIFAP